MPSPSDGFLSCTPPGSSTRATVRARRSPWRRCRSPMRCITPPTLRSSSMAHAATQRTRSSNGSTVTPARRVSWTARPKCTTWCLPGFCRRKGAISGAGARAIGCEPHQTHSAARREGGEERHSAVNEQRGADNVVGLIGGEPYGGTRDVIWLPYAAIRHKLHQRVIGFLGLPCRRVDRRANGARSDAVDTYALGRD